MENLTVKELEKNFLELQIRLKKLSYESVDLMKVVAGSTGDAFEKYMKQYNEVNEEKDKVWNELFLIKDELYERPYWKK